jgi:hypothetical protein
MYFQLNFYCRKTIMDKRKLGFQRRQRNLGLKFVALEYLST